MTRAQIQNLLIETIELKTRLNNLTAFLISLESSALSKDDLDDLHEQSKCMSDYLTILNRRLKRINL